MDVGSLGSLAASAPTQGLVSSHVLVRPMLALRPLFSLPHILVKIELFEVVSQMDFGLGGCGVLGFVLPKPVAGTQSCKLARGAHPR